MAAPTATHLSTAAVGNREDLTDIIDNISPTETPFYSMIRKGKANGTKHEWQTQALRAAGANAHVEGDDTTATAVTPQVRLSNYTQIMKEAASVSGTQEAVDKAGQKGEMSKQLALKSAELKKDIEYQLTRSGVAVTGATRQFRGIRGFLPAANTATVAGYVAPDYVGNVGPTDGTTPRAFSETLLKSAWQAIYVNGGRPTVIMMGAANKQLFSTFTGNANRQVMAATEKLNAAIDVYVGDFGTLSAVVNIEQRTRDVFLIQPDKWEFSVLRPWAKMDLPNNGDAQRKQILVEGTLTCVNPLASGGVLDCT